MNVNINTDSINGIKPNYDFINNFDSNPVMIRILVVIIVAYYTIIYFSVKNEIVPSAIKSSSSIGIIGFLLWLLFIIILLLNGVRYFYDLNIATGIKGIFKREPEIDINVTTVSGKPLVNPVPEIMYEKQVFHVSDNKYDFNNAKAICAAYGSKLASYDQIEQSYNDGAEWCGYGWSDGQMALYPTQKKTYNKLKNIKGHEHDCGRPGINGGYIANPNVKFGVNCYGFKPKMTSAEHKLMKNERMYPLTEKDIAFHKNVYKWKNKLSELLVSPFSKKTWSRV